MSDNVRAIDRPEAATWFVRLRVLVAIAFALIPVIFTAAASAVSQLLHFNDATSVLMIAGGAGVSAALGLVVMKLSPSTLQQYGLRAPRASRTALWFLPLLITVVIAFATQGVHVQGAIVIAYAVLTIVVAVNEEVWFRGIVLTVLRGSGVRVAVIGSSVMFAVLHLANLAGGEDPSAAIAQLVFAALFGVVAAELTVLTGSLWPAIIWHAAWDFTNYISGNAATALALAGIGIACAVILVYAVVLWRPATQGRLRPTHTRQSVRLPS